MRQSRNRLSIEERDCLALLAMTHMGLVQGFLKYPFLLYAYLMPNKLIK